MDRVLANNIPVTGIHKKNKLGNTTVIIPQRKPLMTTCKKYEVKVKIIIPGSK